MDSREHLTQFLAALILSLGVLAPADAVAQSISYEFDHYSVATGLPGDRVNEIFRDSRGIMWFGTDRGLVRYDGFRYQIITSENDTVSEGGIVAEEGISGGLSDNDIYALAEDLDGMIWIGTAAGGLNKLNPESGEIEIFPVSPDSSNGTSHIFINAILPMPDGTVWVATDSGLDFFDGRTFQRAFRENTEDGIAAGTIVTGIVEDEDHTLWISTYDGLKHADPATNSIASFRHDRASATSLSDNRVNTVFRDSEGIIWAGTWAGLDKFNTETGQFSHITHIQNDPESLGASRVYSIAESKEGALWIGTVGNDVADGLNRIDPDTGTVSRFRRNPDNPVGLSGNRIVALLADPDDRLWIGTLFSGANSTDLSGPKFVRYDSDANRATPLPSNEITALEVDALGRLWAGSWGHGLALVDPGTGSVVTNDAVSKYTQDRAFDVLSIVPEPDGSIWLATFNGLWRYDAGTGKGFGLYHNPDDPSTITSNAVSAVHKDLSGVLWVGSWNDGLSVRPAGMPGFIHLNGGIAALAAGSLFPQFPSQKVREIRSDSQGRVWIRTSAELYYFRHGDREFHEVPISDVKTFRIDKHDTVWIGSHARGLIRFDVSTGIVKAFGQEHGLAFESVAGIMDDKNDHIWVVTARGLSRFDPETESFTLFKIDPAFRVGKMGGARAVATKNGMIYFAGGSGILGFDPDRLLQPRADPSAYFVNITVNDNEVSFADGLSLSHDQNDLALTFAGTAYDRTVNPVFRYRLKNHEDEWNDGEAYRTVRYSNLAPGSYEFLLESSTDGRTWTPAPRPISIAISRPWWKMPFAILFFALVLVGGVAGFFRFRVRTLSQRAKQLEFEVSERTSEISSQKELLREQAERLIELDQVKSRFFTNVSHEFRTPLTLILGPLRDALGGFYGNMSRPLSDQLKTMLRNGKRLQNLINQLLDLARIESGGIQLQASRVNVARLVRRIVLSFSSLAERSDIKLQLDVNWDDPFGSDPASTPEVWVDRDKFEQILNNLLSNAIKFTPEEGIVGVSLRISNIAETPQLLLSIVDSGPGISDDDLARVFDRFYQTADNESTGSGTSGVGLAVAKEWASLHKGTILASSPPKGGTQFDVYLPLGSAHLGPHEIEPESDGAIDEQDEVWTAGEFDVFLSDAPGTKNVSTVGAGDLVIVAEDHAEVREYICSHLRNRYRVVQAVDGAETLKMAEAETPALIISDVMMPGMNGFELCKAIKTHDRLADVPVVLLTARAEDSSKLEGLTSGADDYILKPFSADELLVRAENLIDIRRKLRARFSQQIAGVSASEIEVSSADQRFLEKIQTIVEEHLDSSNFGTEWLASDVGISTRQLRRRVKQLTGLSTSGFIRSLRLSRSAQLLEQRAGTVAEIAYAVGFADPRHFSRLFRQIYGLTPSSYALQHRRESGRTASGQLQK